MSQSPRPLFREHALKEYMQRHEKDTLPRSVAPPTIIFAWLLLVIALALAGLAWWAQVPAFLPGNGILLFPASGSAVQAEQGVALILLPPSAAGKVRAGLPTKIQIGNSPQQFQRPITRIRGIQSPQAIRQYYGLSGGTASLVAQPALVAEIDLPPGSVNTQDAGSDLAVQVQVGEQRVISLLPGLNQLIGE
ncbi:MAG TPA: hypothetical protein VL485_23405 [Ktedonobacteraceae bacterium]|jgi:hypothetical protein|nr:hypothetical protein [Ktedonobacteraceae bacterium]